MPKVSNRRVVRSNGLGRKKIKRKKIKHKEQGQGQEQGQAVETPQSFSQLIFDAEPRKAPIRVRKMLLDEWTKVFGEKRFPDEQSNINIFLALQYRKEKNRLDKAGKEVTARFAGNYNKAIRFGGLADTSLYNCLKLKFEGDETMDTKKAIKKNARATAKSQSKKAVKAVKESKGKAQPKKQKQCREPGEIRTNTVRFAVCTALKAGKTAEQVVAYVCKELGREITLGRVSMMRSNYNRGVFEHLGFAAPKVPLQGERIPSTKKAVKKGAEKKAKKVLKKKAQPKITTAKKAIMKIKVR